MTVLEAGKAFCIESSDPAVGALAGHAHRFRDVGDGHPFDSDALDQDAPTVRGQAGVTVRHEDLRGL